MKDLPHAAQSRADFEARLRAIGAERYHDRHPFHARLHGGACTPDEVRAWVINRWMYQSRIPMKDAAFLSRVEDPDLRRIWRKRIEGNYPSSPLAAGGKLYFSSQEGTTTVVEAGPEFSVLATNKLDGAIMASPAVVDGELIMRAGEYLYRIVGE